jgi:O-antigen ligase
MLDKFKNKIFIVGVISLITSMLFGSKIVNLGLLLFAISSILLISFKCINKNRSSLIILMLFYIIHLISLFYTTDIKSGLFDIEIKLSLFVFPLLFLFLNPDKKIKEQIFTYSFFIISLFTVFLIIAGLVRYSNTNNYLSLFYSEFSIFLHPSYLAMYLSVFLLIGVQKAINKNKYRILFIIGSIILIVGIYLTESKAGYFSLILVFIISLIKSLKNIKLGLKHYLFSALVLFILVFAISQNTRFNVMINVIKQYKETMANPNRYKESTGVRLLVWDSAFEVINENFWFGVGAGNVKPKLFEKYKELDYKIPLKLKLNAHSQVVETFIGQGIIGFIIMLLVFIIPFLSAIKRSNIILLGFLIIVFVNFLFESMLNTQAGTIFFGFFYSFLVSAED